MPNTTDTNRSRRGFAAMDPEKQREIARRGGQAAHAHGRAHEFTQEEARAAGKKGGDSVSRDREHMAKIGRVGGLSRSARASEAQQRAAQPVQPQSAPPSSQQQPTLSEASAE